MPFEIEHPVVIELLLTPQSRKALTALRGIISDPDNSDPEYWGMSLHSIKDDLLSLIKDIEFEIKIATE